MKRVLSRFVLIGFVLLSSAEAWGKSRDDQASWPERARRFTTLVKNELANIFDLQLAVFTGTGIIAELTGDRGFVFTNHHVVETGPLLAQRVTLLFNTSTEVPEEVPGKVVLNSPLLDFAVVEFDLKYLKRARRLIEIAPLQRKGDKIRQGDDSMAYGHPLSSQNIVTTGAISGFSKDPDEVRFIQTEAAINPGNSGGPLIDLRLGKVIGINTAKNLLGDNIGLATPILEALEEYKLWREDANYQNQRLLPIALAGWTAKYVKIDGMDSAILERDPKFFEKFNDVLLVEDAPKMTGLQSGDVIISVNGQVMGFDIFEFRKAIQRAKKDRVVLEIVRERKLKKLEVPVVNMEPWRKKAWRDFVMVSGMIVQDLSPCNRWFEAHGLQGVSVAYKLQSAPASQFNSLEPGALITEVQIGGKPYPVRNLSEFKKVLQKVDPKEKLVGFIVHQPHGLQLEDEFVKITATETGRAIVKPRRKVFLTPFDGILTPKELSLSVLRNQLNFDGTELGAREWQNFVKMPACKTALRRIDKDKA